MRFERFFFKALLIAALGAGSSVSAAWAQGVAGPKPQLIVRWKQAMPKAEALRAMSGAGSRLGVSLTPLRTLALGADVVQLNGSVTRQDLQALIASLSKDPAVEYAVENVLLHAAFTPTDPEYSKQWHYFEAVAGINLPSAWDLSTGVGVRVAVLDSGYRPHRDLLANLVGGYDFISDPFISNDGDGRDAIALDEGDASEAGSCSPGSLPSFSSWHGTHVAGTIAAVTNNATGVAGVAFGAKVVPVRVLGRCGGLLSDVAEAAIWAAGGSVAGVPANANPAKVLNLSLSAPAACNAFAQATINAVRSLGAVVIAAAGNGNTDAKESLPANCDGVVVVAAVARNGNKASYSNFGDIVDVAAPGGELAQGKASAVLSTSNNGSGPPGIDALAYEQGTSMSTAHVSGVAALMLARSRGLTPDKIEDVLKSTARPVFSTTSCKCGTGIVNAFDAVNALGVPVGNQASGQ